MQKHSVPCVAVVAFPKCVRLARRLGDNKAGLWFQSGSRRNTIDSVEISVRNGKLIDFLGDS